MSLSIVFTGKDGDYGPFSLASASGWGAFAEWAESLPDRFDALKTLADTGQFSGTDRLSNQLSHALSDHPPTDPIRHTVEGLLKNLGVGDPGETATVTD